MKKLFVTTITFFMLAITLQVNGQQKYRSFLPASRIIPYALKTGYYKTTVLIFPAPIATHGIDRGSGDIIAKTVNGVENILKVKANRKDFHETNLTVITTDGKVYSFRVNYSKNPPDAPINLAKQAVKEKSLASFENKKLNSAQLKTLARSAVQRKGFLHQSTTSYKIKLRLIGIYSCKDVVCFQFELKNKSNLDYTIGLTHFSIKDKRQARRTAIQEKEIEPLYMYYERGKAIPGKTKKTIAVIFPKFTIANHKEFTIQLNEKNGDRQLNLDINGRTIVKAKTIKPDFNN